MTNSDTIPINHQLTRIKPNLGWKPPVSTIVLRQVRNSRQICRLINCNNLHLLATTGFIQRAQQATADPAIAVDRQPNHLRCSSQITINPVRLLRRQQPHQR